MILVDRYHFIFQIKIASLQNIPRGLSFLEVIRSKNPFARGCKLYSITCLKCPRCQKGNLFSHPNPYNFRELDKMPKACDVCGEDFWRETGFYYGAMMISHATTTLIAVVVHFTVFYFYGWEIAPHLISLTTILLSLFPIVFRTSRAIWINFFVNYDPAKLK